MKKTDTRELDATRRRVIQAMFVLPAAALAGRTGHIIDAASFAGSPGMFLAPTPACPDDDDPTPAQTEGPFFKRSSPERASLIEPRVKGTRLIVAGQVFSTACTPIKGALLDFWQSDDRGVYDNTGFTLRGHQFTNASGKFSLETIVPGLYGGRARHIHVKVQAPNGRILTTQLYFPGETANARDRIFSDALVMKVADGAKGKQGAFNFVLA